MALVELSAEEKMVFLLPFPRFLQRPKPLRPGKSPSLVLYYHLVYSPLTFLSVVQLSSVLLSQTRLHKKVWNNPFFLIWKTFPKFAEYSSKKFSMFSTISTFFIKFLEDISPFYGAPDIPVLDFWWLLPWVLKPGWIPLLVWSIACQQHIPQIHPWCNTCWSLGGQHSSQAISIHTLVYKHWWGWSPGLSMPLPYKMWQGKRSTDWAKPGSAQLCQFKIQPYRTIPQDVSM